MKPWEKYGKPWEKYGAVEEEEEEDTFFPRTLSEAGDSLAATAGGFTEAFAKPIYGALDWADVDVEGMGALSKSSRARAMKTLQDSQEGHGFAGGAGGLIGNISQFAVPAAGAAKLVKAKDAVKAAIAGDTAYAGLLGSISPDEGESRLENALEESGLALAGGAVGAGASKLVSGINVKEGVDKFMKEGGYLTPGQAAETSTVKLMENIASITPFLGRGVGEIQEAATDSVSPTFINKVAKFFGKEVDEGGQAGIKQVKKIINDGYDDAWAKVPDTAWTPDTKRSFADTVKAEAKYWGKDEAATLSRITRNLVEDIPSVPTNRFKRPQALPKSNPVQDVSLKRIDRQMRDMIESTDNYDFQKTLRELRDDLRSRAGESANDALSKMDAGYGDFLAVQDAAAKTRFGNFDAGQLERSSRAKGGIDRASRGVAPLQEASEQVAKLMEKKGGLPLLDFVKWIGRLGPNLIPVGAAKKFGNYMIGQTRTQRQINAYLKKHPDIVQALTIYSASETFRGEQ